MRYIMKNKSWKIKKINTSFYAKKFAEILEENGSKTYFLQGVWGSGKTEYLKEVEKNAKDNLKFIYLKLWEPKNNETLAKSLFSAIHPNLMGLVNFGTFLYILLTILASSFLSLISIIPKINIIAKGKIYFSINNNDFVLYLILVVIIFVSLLGFLKDKALNEDKLLMYLSLRSLHAGMIKNKVLVIDDFDRIDKDLQKELYKVFNAIHEGKKEECWFLKQLRGVALKMKVSFKGYPEERRKKEFKDIRPGGPRVIFVGDLDNIVKIKDNYLRKIVDQVISLPLMLSAQNFTGQIQDIIKTNIDNKTNIDLIKKMFIDERRTLRDGNQFLAYAKNEFIDQEKKGRVQTDQQLLIIYLYLFHRKDYKELVDSAFQKRNVQFLDISIKKYDKSITEVLERKGNIYPYVFKENKLAYFINELTSNKSVLELDDIIDNPSKLITLLYPNNLDDDKDINNEVQEDYNELKLYIEGMELGLYGSIRERLETNAIAVMRKEPRHKPNELLKFILQKWIKNIPEKILEKRNYFNIGASKKGKDFVKEINYIYVNLLKTNLSEYKNKSFGENLYIQRCRWKFAYWNYYDSENEKRKKDVVNRYSITRLLSEDKEISRKINDKIKNNFGHELYDAEYLLLKLGFFKDEWKYDNIIFLENRPSIRSEVDYIEELSDYEYIAFWDEFRDNNELDADDLNFYFNENNKKDIMYFDHERKRYSLIKQFIASIFPSKDDSDLSIYLNGPEWSDFILKLAAVIHLDNMRDNTYKSVIRNKINQILDAYNCRNDELSLQNDKIVNHDEGKVLKILEQLVHQVKIDPTWVKKAQSNI